MNTKKEPFPHVFCWFTVLCHWSRQTLSSHRTPQEFQLKPSYSQFSHSESHTLVSMILPCHTFKRCFCLSVFSWCLPLFIILSYLFIHFHFLTWWDGWLCTYLYFSSLYFFSFHCCSDPISPHGSLKPHLISHSTLHLFLQHRKHIYLVHWHAEIHKWGLSEETGDGWRQRADRGGDAEGLWSQVGTRWQLWVMAAITVSLCHHSPF